MNNNKLHWSSEYLHDCPQQHQQQQYMSKVELEQQTAGLMYPGKVVLKAFFFLLKY
jgi:hypothetical protein